MLDLHLSGHFESVKILNFRHKAQIETPQHFVIATTVDLFFSKYCL